MVITAPINKKFEKCKIHESFKTYEEYINYYGVKYNRPIDEIDGPLYVNFFEVLYGYHSDEKSYIRHRLDGPAVIYPSGYNEWYIHGKFASSIIKIWAKENEIDLDNLTDVDKALIRVTWNYGIN